MSRVVSPVLHKYVKANEELKVTESPSHTSKGPAAVMTGCTDKGITLTWIGFELAEVQPFPSVTVAVYCPEVDTSMGEPLCPLFQLTRPVPLACKVTDPPSQKARTPAAVTNGAAGGGKTVTAVGAEGKEGQPLKSTIETL